MINDNSLNVNKLVGVDPNGIADKVLHNDGTFK